MSSVVCYHDVTSAAHQGWVDRLSPEGYRPVALNVSGDTADPRYAAVWVQRPGPGWRAVHDVPEAEYQDRFDAVVAEGFAPVIVTATGPGDAAVFAAVFVADEPRWFARHALRWGAEGDGGTINAAMRQAFADGFVARSVAVYGTAGDPRFAGVWTENAGTLWAWYWGDYAFHQRTFDAQEAGGLHPSQVAVGAGMLLSVFTDDHVGAWSARHEMTAADYAAAVAEARVQGRRPTTVQAGDLGPATRYAATFAADERPMARRWRVAGRSVAGEADLDAVASDVMRRFGARAASVAIARRGVTYVARAYTWAEDDWPVTKPSTTFRIASVSKAFTCAAVRALADDGVLNLDATVFAYLGLPCDAAHAAITIRHCATGQSGLPHDFDGATTFRDIGRKLGHMASIRELAAYSATVPLGFVPGMRPPGFPDDGYSNSAFHVLGAVVEQASGQPLADYVRRRLGAAIGVLDLRAGATGPGLRLPGEVAGYQASGVGPSQLDLADDAVAPDAYGGALLLDSAPGSGGLVASAASVARFIGFHAVWDLGGRVGGARYGTFKGTTAIAASYGDWDLSFLMNREVANDVKDAIRARMQGWLDTNGGRLRPLDLFERFPVRGVLLAGRFRTQAELNTMSHDDMRNTLIVELTKHSAETVAACQARDDATLAGMGAVMAFLLRTGIRDATALRTMSADEQRNTLIVELDAQTGAGRELQGLTELELVLVALGSDRAVRGRAPGVVSCWTRGVLLAGGFRTQHELNKMSQEDMRNTLIVELTNHSNQTDYQAYDDLRLAGAGAVMVLLWAIGSRDDAALRTMSAGDQRNTLIVELDEQANLGPSLQALSDLELVLVGLGVRSVPE